MVPNCRCAARHETVIEKEINSSPISSYLVLPLDLDRGKIVDQLMEPFCELNRRRVPRSNQSGIQLYIIFLRAYHYFRCIDFLYTHVYLRLSRT